MARLCTLASGSKGNSTYISTTDGDIIVDAGISAKALLTAVSQIGDISKLRAIAITHTHSDHINGLKPFLNKVKIPVIASTDTLEALATSNLLPAGIKTIIADNGAISIGDLNIDFFKTSHDAKGSGGYVITIPDGRRAAICTDLGIMTDEIRSKLLGCEVVLMESNHDVEMLRRGPYPASLKLRILSDEGHLSNNACAVELPSLLKSGTNRIILGHLSAENNTPLLARQSAQATLMQIGAKDGIDYILETAKPTTIGVTAF